MRVLFIVCMMLIGVIETQARSIPLLYDPVTRIVTTPKGAPINYTQLVDNVPGTTLVKRSTESKTVYIGTPGKTTMSLSAWPAVDLGSGKIGLRCEGHAFVANDPIRLIGGIASVYDNDSYMVDTDTSSDTIVISGTFSDETFGTDSVKVYYRQSITSTAVRAIIEAEPKFNIGQLTYIVYPGVYVFEGSIHLSSFVGGLVTFRGETSSSTSELNDVRFEWSTASYFICRRNAAAIIINGIDFWHDPNIATSFTGMSLSYNSGPTKIYYCKFLYTGTPPLNTIMGVYAYDCNSTVVAECRFGSYNIGVGLYDGAGSSLNNHCVSSAYKPKYGVYCNSTRAWIIGTKISSSIAESHDDGAISYIYNP